MGSLTITEPDGSELLRSVPKVLRVKAQGFRFDGKRRPPGGWMFGRHRADYSVRWEDPTGPQEILRVTREIELR